MQLGTLLLRDGLITLDDLEAALRSQILYGGRLGTNLVEAGAIDLETLGAFLSRAFGTPLAPQERFERADRAALDLVPPDSAGALVVCPLGFDDDEGQILALAMADPGDLDAVEALVENTGCAIARYVAPELRIRYYLERHLGVSREARFIRPGTLAGPPRTRGERRRMQPPRGLELPPALRLSPRDERRATATAASEAPADIGGAPSGGPAPTREEGADDRFARAEATPEGDSAPRPADAPDGPPDISPSERAPAAADGATESAREAPGDDPAADAGALRPELAPEGKEAPQKRARESRVPLDKIVLAVERARAREDVGDAVESFARGRADLLALFTVRDGNALGWRCSRGDGTALSITPLSIPLGGASALQAAHDSARSFRGAPPAPGRPAETRLWREAEINEEPEIVAVVPVIVGERVVNLLYLHAPPGGDLDGPADELSVLAETMAETYVRLIREAKQARSKPA